MQSPLLFSRIEDFQTCFKTCSLKTIPVITHVHRELLKRPRTYLTHVLIPISFLRKRCVFQMIPQLITFEKENSTDYLHKPYIPLQRM